MNLETVKVLVRFIWFIWSNRFGLVGFGSSSDADLVGSVLTCWFPMVNQQVSDTIRLSYIG